MKSVVIGAAFAGFTAFGASAATIDFSQGQTENNSAVLFAENSGVAVAADAVTVDYVVGDNLSVGDTVGGATQFTDGLGLAAGTYDSFLVHFDPVGRDGKTKGTFSFVGDIVALIVSNGAGSGNTGDGTTEQLLNLSDGTFGAAGNTFEQTISRRSEDNDSFTLVDANTISFFFSTSGNYIDNARIITQVAAVPVPASLPLLLVGLGGLAAMRRNRKS